MALLHDNRTAWNKKTVLFLHGIGFQPLQFSEPLYKILYKEDPAAADATRWHEIVYDQANDEMKRKVVELQKYIPKDAAKPAPQELAADFLVDLVDYLALSSLYHWINNFGRKALLDVIAQGNTDGVLPEDHELILISHSLGTVVAYELLHGILTDPQVPGLSSGVRFQYWLTMGSPLAFIKANQSRIPSLNSGAFLRSAPINRPWMDNPFTGKVSNVINWYNYRQAFDPVGSLIPLDQKTAQGELSRETSVFKSFNTGVNAHDFANYITEFRSEITGWLRA